MLTIAPRRTKPLRVGLWGCGHLGQQIAAGIRAGHGGNVQVVGVLARRSSPELLETAASLGAEPCTSLDDFLRLEPAIVLEVARAEALAELGPKILEAGVDLVALSPSCLFDPAVEARFRQVVEATGRRVLIPSASAQGVDLLLATRRDQLRSVQLTVTWRPTDDLPPYTGDGGPQQVFSGSAREVGQRYPRHLNYVVAFALAGLGLDATRVRIQIDPGAASNGYVLEADAYAASLRVQVELRRPEGRRGRLAALTALQTLRELTGAPEF